MRTAVIRFYLSPLVLLMVPVVFSHFAMYQVNATGNQFLAHYVQFFIVAASPALLLPDSWRSGIQVRMAIWSLMFLAVVTSSVYFVSPGESSIEALKRLVAALMFMQVCLALFAEPTLNRLGLKTLAVCVPCLALLNVAELFNQDLFVLSQQKGRSAAFFVNPNVSAMLITLGMLIALRVVAPKIRLWYVGAVFCGVLVTWSRMGILGFIAAFVCLTLVDGIQIGRLKKLSSVLVLLVGMGLAVFANALAATLAPDLVGSPDVALRRGQVMSGAVSDAQRVDLLLENLDLYVSDPWIGTGFFNTRDELVAQGPHNMYVAMAAEMGTVGLLAFVSWFMVMWRPGHDWYSRISVFYLAFVSFFNHNVLDYQSTMLLVALIAVPSHRVTREAFRTVSLRRFPAHGAGSSLLVR